MTQQVAYIDLGQSRISKRVALNHGLADLEEQLGNFGGARVNFQRLWDDIHFTAQWGLRQASEGMHRLALSRDDQAVRKWFVEETTALGCATMTDAMGNIFAIYPGESPDLPPIAMGSHLDTQPAGGRYDGILGVLAAVEVIRAIKDAGIRTVYPIAAVAWTNEEGAAFFPGCSGSSVWTGWVPLEDAYRQEHCVTGQTLEAALDDIGAKGSIPASSKANLFKHISSYIEQGPVLEAAKESIGVVRNIQGIRRYKITCHGKQGHAGTVRMPDRADALIAASKLILRVEEIAKKCNAYATVGLLQVENPSPNTIASQVSLTVDARHTEESTLDDLERQMFDYLSTLSSMKPDWTFDKKKVWHSPALIFDEELAECIASAAVDEYGESQARDMISRRTRQRNDGLIGAHCDDFRSKPRRHQP